MTAVYDRIGVGYAELRRPDPRIAAIVHAALGDARSVINVGAGSGSYEPVDRAVVAVEPSEVMLAQRAGGLAVRAVAEALPFADGAFDAGLAVLTTHHWTDPARGLDELARVSGRQVVLTWDQARVASEFWFVRDYLPEAVEREAGLAALDAVVGHWPAAQVLPVPVPHDCTDGFFAAYWRRPQAYLVPAVRAAISACALLDQAVVERAVRQLAADLDSGAWERRYADLMGREVLDVGYRLVVRG